MLVLLAMLPHAGLRARLGLCIAILCTIRLWA
jgi:hypothetical protein